MANIISFLISSLTKLVFSGREFIFFCENVVCCGGGVEMIKFQNLKVG